MNQTVRALASPGDPTVPFRDVETKGSFEKWLVEGEEMELFNSNFN